MTDAEFGRLQAEYDRSVEAERDAYWNRENPEDCEEEDMDDAV
jgi:hypothetical protein